MLFPDIVNEDRAQVTTLTPSEIIVITARLEQAEKAYHNIMTGKAPRVFVDQNGERVEYHVANASRLSAYIVELKGLLGVSRQPLGPMRVFL